MTAAREAVSSVPDDLVQELENNDAWMDFEKWPASQKKAVPLLAGECKKDGDPRKTD